VLTTSVSALTEIQKGQPQKQKKEIIINNKYKQLKKIQL
jgi:hypothetical protein